MTMDITYVAFDGKRFDDEDECREYETRLRNIKFAKDAMFFNSKGEPLSFDEDGFLSATFILCKTDAAAEYLQNEYSHNYYTPWDDFPMEAGCWIHDEDGDWRLAEDCVSILKSNLGIILSVLKIGGIVS